MGWALVGLQSLAVVAVLLHVVPPIPYYLKFGPFGIRFDYTPTKLENGRRVPDKRAEQADEALLINSETSIYARINISKRLESFSLQFCAPDEVDVQLRDVPLTEHFYNQEDRILSAPNIFTHNFNIVLDIYGDNTKPGEEYPLHIVDESNNRTIKTVKIISQMGG